MFKQKLSAAITAASFAFLSAIHAQQVPDAQASTPELRALESHRYENFAYLTPFSALLSMPQNQSNAITVVSRTNGIHGRVGGASTDHDAWMHELVANSSLVVVGRPVDRISSITAQQTFVFSDYDFQVEAVIKDSMEHVSKTAQIVVTRAGGEMQWNGKSIRAIVPEFQMLRLGERYLMFLTRIPETGTYKVDEDRAFLLRGSNIIPAKTNPSHLLKDTQEADFIFKVRGFAASEAHPK